MTAKNKKTPAGTFFQYFINKNQLYLIDTIDS